MSDASERKLERRVSERSGRSAETTGHRVSADTAEWMRWHERGKKILGVVGGLGPETGFRFSLNINDKFKAETGSQPHLIVVNLPITGESEERLIHGGVSEEHFRLLEETMALFNKAKVDLIAIPCNTVHVFIEELRAISKAPILSILEETAKKAAGLGIRCAGLLSSTKTVNERLHANELDKTGIAVIVPDNNAQGFVSDCIVRIINREATADDRHKLLEIMKGMERRGAQGIILGCTDLPLLISEPDAGLPVINTIAVLEDAVVSRLLETAELRKGPVN
ncbi:MAG: amino acid racemase [Candidatus Burarchaeum sp.]|nr:amino acid racemase [Candidatus Burarchaeum sp.]MDO8340209.1 amino acid racemase [Candidatus Burarchaeum sp.]